MRYLAIDLGDKRTGVAAGDDVTGIITPLQVIAVAPSLLMDELMKAITSHKPDAIVLGLPLNADGSDSPAAKKTRAFGETLAQRATLPVHYQDERLTSYAADQTMARTGRTRKDKKELRDALAAAEILRDFLDSREP
jgi:putative Holliday junction resolvase